VQSSLHIWLGREHSKPNVTEDPSPEHQYLVRYLLQCCPNALMQFEMDREHSDSNSLLQASLETHPRVHTLNIDCCYDPDSVPVSTLQQVLAYASNHLYSLIFDICIFFIEVVKRSAHDPSDSATDILMMTIGHGCGLCVNRSRNSK
jgi:hypothetical protein